MNCVKRIQDDEEARGLELPIGDGIDPLHVKLKYIRAQVMKFVRLQFYSYSSPATILDFV